MQPYLLTVVVVVVVVAVVVAAAAVVVDLPSSYECHDCPLDQHGFM